MTEKNIRNNINYLIDNIFFSTQKNKYAGLIQHIFFDIKNHNHKPKSSYMHLIK